MDHFEPHIRDLAREFPYPPTPPVHQQFLTDVRGTPRPGRRALAPAWVWLTALIVLVMAGLMAVPSVRAAILEFLQIGAIRIFPGEEIPPLEESPFPSTNDPSLPSQVMTATPYATPYTPGRLNSVLTLAGETTLDEAQQKVPVPLLLPVYPPDLSAPDKVYYQMLDGGWGVLFIWFDPAQPERILMSLLLLGPGANAGKGGPETMTETKVNGVEALWLEGDHILVLQTDSDQLDLYQFFVQGKVLVWEVDGVTYRLESETLSMEEAVKIAESMR